MQTWGVRSILGVPMIVREDVVGILYLDNEEAPHAFTEQQQAVASAFAHLAGIAIQQAQRAAELRTNLQTVARQNELLRHSTAIEEKLTRLVLEGGTLADIATAASDLTGKPCAIHDAGFRRLAVGAPSRRRSPLFQRARRGVPEPAGRPGGAGPPQAKPPVVVDAVPGDGLLHRFLVARVVLHGKAWGYLAVMEFGSRFTALDLATSRHAATAIAIELSVEGRATTADGQAREGAGPRPRQRARGPGGARAPRRAAELPHGEPAPGLPARLRRTRPPRSSAEEVERAYADVAPGDQPWLTAVPQNGVALVLELDESAPRPVALAKAKETVERLRVRLAAKRTVLAAISSACVAPADYGCAYKETQQVLGCLRSLRGVRGRRAVSAGRRRPRRRAADAHHGRRRRGRPLHPQHARPAARGRQPHARGAARHRPRVLRRATAACATRRSTSASTRTRSATGSARVLELTGLDVATDSAAQLTVPGRAADPQDPGPAAGCRREPGLRDALRRGAAVPRGPRVVDPQPARLEREADLAHAALQALHPGERGPQLQRRRRAPSGSARRGS